MIDRFYMFPNFLQELTYSLLAPEAVGRRQGLYLRPVLRHPFQRDHPLAAQRCQNLYEQLLQPFRILHAKIRERVATDFLAPSQPLIGRIGFA